METDVKAKAKQMLVTPKMAEQWLEKNTGNRPLSDRTVHYLFVQMKKGRWQISTDAIGFDEDGRLLNGQHRLNALIKYGKPLEMLVAFGLSPTAFKVLDTGRIRTAGDALGIGGYENPSAKAAIAKFMLMFKKGLRGSGSRESAISNTEIFDFCEKNPKVNEVHEKTLKITRKFKSIQNKYIGGLYWMFSDIDQKYADAFFELYSSGAGLTENHPVFILRQKLILDDQSIKKYPKMDKVAWTILAWNAFRQGKKLTRFRWNAKSDEFPKPI